MIWLKESSIPVDRPELLKLGVAVHALKLNQGIFAIEVNLILERPIQHYTIADNVDGLLLCWNSLLVQPRTAADLKN